MGANVGDTVDLRHIVPILTCKHSLEYCRMFASRAASDGFVGRRIRRLLGKAGCRIILTDDDEAAGLLLDQEEEGIDLLVVDLPEGERGGELDGPLKAALRRHGRVPVLLLSDPTLSSADASGLPCLQKPFGPTELLETTAMVLGGRLPAS